MVLVQLKEICDVFRDYDRSAWFPEDSALYLYLEGYVASLLLCSLPEDKFPVAHVTLT